MAKIYFFMLVGVGLINLVYSILVVRGLAEAGVKVGLYELRWQVHKHMKTYKQITIKRDGRVGFSYYGYLVSLVLLIFLALLLVLSLTAPTGTEGSL